MKNLVLSLMMISGITGLIGSYFWFRSAIVPIKAPGSFEPVDEADKANFWNAGLMTAFQKSAFLNKTAAALTGLSVLLASIAVILGTLG
jgi:multisubunit Na+/H+ antiporter MnhG subunit